MVPQDKARDTGQKLEQKSFLLDIRKHSFSVRVMGNWRS